ncbi:MAG: hypothetical protein LBL58_02755 [Tannerellaceae bacterium]|jgi:hypothetical protein|nr:hypothetical protein [Tannerellaceae bacterium]
MKTYFYIILLLLTTSCSQAQEGWINKEKLNEQEIKNIKALSNLYGLVRYFYPNQNVESLNWYKFLIYGQTIIEDVETDEELIEKLEFLFRPIAPELSFCDSSQRNLINNGDFIYLWKHTGIGKKPVDNDNTFKSEIIECTNHEEGIPIADSLYCFQLLDEVNVYLPIAISYKHPKKNKQLQHLIKELDNIKYKLFTENLYNIVIRKKEKKFQFLESEKFRIADIIIRWHIVKHFYPYFREDNLEQSWDETFNVAVNNALSSQNQEEYYYAVCNLFSNVKDSHIQLMKNAYLGGFYAGYLPSFHPDISVSYVNDTVIFNPASSAESKDEKRFDEYIVRSLNNKDIDSLIKEKRNYISASNIGASNQKLFSNNMLFECLRKDSVLNISMQNGKIVTIHTSNTYPTFSVDMHPYFLKKMEGDIYYINPTYHAANYEEFKTHIGEFQESKGLVFDLRGYPSNYIMDNIITHLSNDKIKWGDFRLPVYYYPNQMNVIYKTEIDYLYPSEDYINVPLVFLINENSISYCETIIEILKRNNIGILVGSNTNGTNGDITMINLPVFSFTMTAIKDFSGYHGKGIEPDIMVQKTVKGVINNEDEELKTAIYYLSNKMETNH